MGETPKDTGALGRSDGSAPMPTCPLPPVLCPETVGYCFAMLQLPGPGSAIRLAGRQLRKVNTLLRLRG